MTASKPKKKYIRHFFTNFCLCPVCGGHGEPSVWQSQVNKENFFLCDACPNCDGDGWGLDVDFKYVNKKSESRTIEQLEPHFLRIKKAIDRAFSED